MSIVECNSIHNIDNAFKNCSVLFIKVTKLHIPVMYYMISKKKETDAPVSGLSHVLLIKLRNSCDPIVLKIELML